MNYWHIFSGKLKMTRRPPVLFIILCFFVTVNAGAQPTIMHEKNLPVLFNDDGDDFIIIAHRGASAHYPENTMIAFRKAVEMNAEMIELDVALSKDGVPVVFHDTRLNQHTNGRGYLTNHTLDELKQLDAGSWFGPQFSGQTIPTLREVIAFASDTIALNIEIKPEAVSDSIADGIEKKVVELVEEFDMQNHVLFSSFDYRALLHFKELAPQVPVALLYSRGQSNHLLPNQLVKKYNVDAFNCSYRQLSKKWIANLNQYRIPSFVYTINSKRRMQKLIEAGVNGIFTDKPNLLRNVVKQYQSKAQ